MTLLPSLAVSVPEKVSTELLRDDDWMMQEKKDGKRIMVYRDPAGWLHYSNKAGQPAVLPKGAILPAIPVASLIDCEYLYDNKTLCALDLLQWNQQHMAKYPAVDRYTLLRDVIPDTGMALVECAFYLDDKFLLLTKLRDARAEGIVLKHKQRPYTPGKPLYNPPVIKVPWRKRMDVVLRKPENSPKRHFHIWAYQDGLPFQIGEIAAASWWDKLVPGGAQVFEIEYLYASKHGRLVQPQIVRPRTDKLPKDCLVSQAQVGGRHAS